MITAVHALIYAEDPEAARAFFRDVVRFPFADTGGGWLIFGTGPSELGLHPRSWPGGGSEETFDVSLICDDLDATMADLASRGATFGEIAVREWGRTVPLNVPGARPVILYQPTYQPPALTL